MRVYTYTGSRTNNYYTVSNVQVLSSDEAYNKNNALIIVKDHFEKLNISLNENANFINHITINNLKVIIFLKLRFNPLAYLLIPYYYLKENFVTTMSRYIC